MNSDILTLFQPFMPFQVDDIYLKDNKKEIKAVCSNKTVTKFLAECVNAFKNVSDDTLNKAEMYKDFIKAAYCLDIAITKSKIQINSIETIFLEKAYNVFKIKLNDILNLNNVKLDGQEQTQTIDS